TIGTLTNQEGRFSLSIPDSKGATLVVSFLGMEKQEIDVSEVSTIDVVLKETEVRLEDVIVVGYGSQKKESVVGAIAQTKGDVLVRTGGVTNVASTLTGNLPGVVTIQGTGKPGAEDPVILIRGQGTWNNAKPLVLVDGIERSLDDLDINSIQSISVLKDASATAVFGVKGANGVILVTTKRGAEGKANISVSSNVTMKVPSKLPNKYDAYDALRYRNVAIERELGLSPSSWDYITPVSELGKYRNPANQEEAERYPNVDWQKESFKDYAFSNNNNISISGGTPFVKYYNALDMIHEGDVLKVRENNKGYTPGYGYNRLNIRSNLDFNLTKTTTLSTNLAGIYASQKETWSDFEYTIWQNAYTTAPDVFPVQYSDGYWGYWLQDVQALNSLRIVSNTGIRNRKTTSLNTDFTLSQDLSMLVKGLNFKGTVAMDNQFISVGGIYDDGSAFQKWISPDGKVYYKNTTGRIKYDYVLPEWSVRSDQMDNTQTNRKLFYQMQLNYSTKILLHDITAMGLFSRDKVATGSEFPHYREDWVFRFTYNYDLRYFIEVNGAYNGSEKFSNKYRFDFFPSAAIGWSIADEKIVKNNLRWINRLKIRASYGYIGNDDISNVGRWLYLSQWSAGGSSSLGLNNYSTSPYTWYKEAVIGNPELHWEKVRKTNVGVDYAFLNSLIEGSFDIFNDYRTDILVPGSSRAIPSYFGGVAPVANLGKVNVKGYELEIKLSKTFPNGFRPYINFNMSHAVDKIIERDDPQLLDDYQKQAGFSIGQYRSHVITDYYNTWNEVYGSTPVKTNDHQKLPGNYNIIDFNADGVIDDYDVIPNGYPERPQNTYNTTVGFDYKGFSFMIQFYGVTNVTRYMSYSNFAVKTNILYDQGEYWSKENPNAPSFMPRWATVWDYYGNFYAYDGSYLRLKNAEIAYTLESKSIQRLGLKSMRIFLNGNNLYLWTKMPDDRESNLGQWGGMGTYPTVRRINLGVKLTL
ncbi:MAG: SusC/RagA family TonB-linked outer membrane protein, partial [Bacteroidales bacterium]|nr:SusC/RagA family TonB-linked outer membrane protein [Bacteroidales bacterium]